MKYPKLLPALFLLLPFLGFAQQAENPMVREEQFIIVTSEQLPIEANNEVCPHDEILVIVQDVLGNDTYSKVVFKYCEGEPLTACDPYNRIPSGVYTIIGSAKQEFYAQKLVID